MRDPDAAAGRTVTPAAPDFAETNAATFMARHGFEDVAALRERACSDLAWFWDEVVDALGIEFDTDYDAVRRGSDPAETDWYVGGELNLATTTVDRHARERPEATALVWEGEPGDSRELTFADLRRETNRVANALTAWDVGVGDVVGLVMGRLPAAVVAIYGALKAGAIVAPVFSGYGETATRSRLDAAGASVLFTCDGFHLGGSEVDLLDTAETMLATVPSLERAVAVERLATRGSGEGVDDRETEGLVSWARAVGDRETSFEPRSVPAAHPSMLLFTSGTTGEPKGTIQTHAGQVVKCAKDLYFDFDHRPEDLLFWVTDFGWVMGPWAAIGTHALGGGLFVYEGGPATPDLGRYWRLIERHGVSTFGISPSGVRKLRSGDPDLLAAADLSSLRLLGATGEPLEADAWWWFYETVGGGRCPIVNVSGGTELGGHFLAPLPGRPLTPSTVGAPSLGVDVRIVDDDGDPIDEPGRRGHLVIADSCPSMTRGLWDGDDRYRAEYWSTWEGLWDHGDWVRRDADGFWYVLGRADDVITMAGRRISAAEVEATLNEHDAVRESAAVGLPDVDLGERLAVCVVPAEDADDGDIDPDAIRRYVGQTMGKPFRPATVHVVPALPKTQSGKIVRQTLADGLDGDVETVSAGIRNGDVLRRL